MTLRIQVRYSGRFPKLVVRVPLKKPEQTPSQPAAALPPSFEGSRFDRSPLTSAKRTAQKDYNGNSVYSEWQLLTEAELSELKQRPPEPLVPAKVSRVPYATIIEYYDEQGWLFHTECTLAASQPVPAEAQNGQVDNYPWAA